MYAIQAIKRLVGQICKGVLFFFSDQCLDCCYLLFVFLLLYQKNVPYTPVFHMFQVAHFQPILKSDKGNATLISHPKTGVNHGVENDAG
jgi:hypothetical protein